MKLLRLSLPFAWVAATQLVFPFNWSMLALIAAAAMVGALLTHRLGEISLVELLGSGLAGGAVCGLALIPLSGWQAPIGGAWLGCLGALPLTPVVGAAEWVDARPGSLLDGVGLRCTFITAALVSMPFVVWGRAIGGPLTFDLVWLLINGTLVLLCSAVDAGRFLALSRWRGDLGIGNVEYQLTVEGPIYRQEQQVTAVYRGDPRQTRRILLRQLTFDVCALTAVLTLLTLALRQE